MSSVVSPAGNVVGSGANPSGSPAPGWVPTDAAGLVAFWDAGNEAKDAGYVQSGGYDLNQNEGFGYFDRTSGTIPGLNGSGQIQFPLTVVSYWYRGAGAGDGTHWEVSNNSTTARFGCYLQTNDAYYYFTTGGFIQLVGGAPLGQWIVGIYTLATANSRGAWTSSLPAGGTSATAFNPSGMFKLMVGREYDLNPGFHLGETGPIWFLPVDLTGDAATRNAILGGADPITACGLTIDDVYAYYAMDNDGGADSSPNAYNLTAQGAPSPRNYLFALRDQSANGVNLRATTGAPTWDATAFSNRGGAVFNGTSQFLVRDAAPIAAAPIQAYGVAESSSLAADQGVFWLGDKDAGNQWWTLMFNGVNPGDPVAWYVETGAGVAAFSSTGYSANTPHLLWGIEAASNNREVELDGAGNGTNGTNLTPVGVDRVGLGAYLDSSPSNYLSGQIGAVLLLDTASIAEQSDMFAWVEDQFGIVLP